MNTVESHDSISNGRHILVTGGAGYIGSHTTVLLLEAGYEVTIIDNLINSSIVSLDRVREITQLGHRLHFFQVDLRNQQELENFFAQSPQFWACIHFAGLKAVGESTQLPLLYYENNICGTLNLLKLLQKYNCKKIVFSSSATVYGKAELPISENSVIGLGITNPYGRNKYMIEEILRDLYNSPEGRNWGIIILRYFNPVGAHPSGRIGEDPNGPPNNLMPYVSQVAVGKRPFVTIFGNDYDTKDGTGVRDYIHVMDLASGHLAALDKLLKEEQGNFVYNLGTGRGYSVLEMIHAMQTASGRNIQYQLGPRRPGDIDVCFASAQKAKEELNWEAKLNLDDMCSDLWRWQINNPNGFQN